MSKITYTDKQFLYENSDIPAINKVQDSDMNEIKQVVNENDDNVGSLDNLNTTDKTNLVNATNEITPLLNTISNSGTIKIGYVGIEWGTVSIAPSNGYGTESVNLVNEYKNNPVAIACANVGTSAITNVGVFGVSTTSISVFLVGSGTTARSCRYLVIGELASLDAQNQEAQNIQDGQLS